MAVDGLVVTDTRDLPSTMKGSKYQNKNSIRGHRGTSNDGYQLMLSQ